MAKETEYTTWESLPDTLTAEQISQFLGISRRRIYELLKIPVNQGGIQFFQIGITKRVEKSDLIHWISQKKEEKSNI